MSNKTMKILIVILAAATLFNIAALLVVNKELAKPQTFSSLEVLGAVFKSEAESNVIEVDLVRPPRKSVEPGTTTEENMVITSTSETPLCFRANFKVIVEDGKGNKVDYSDKVKVELYEGWHQKDDGHFYYEKTVDKDDKLYGPIKSITYSEKFKEHRDYKVYIPVIVDGVEMLVENIDNIDCWPNDDIDKVDYKRMVELTSWTTTSTIQILG